MKTWIGLAALAVLLGAVPSYAFDPKDRDPRPYIESQPSSHSTVIEGDVVRIDPDSYVIRDLAGREMRVYFDRTTLRENISVGDHVVVNYDRSGAPYAASIVRRTPGAVAPAGGVMPRPQTIEGEVLRINSDSYLIRDLSGREIRIRVDRSTKLDGNLTPGDKVVARVLPSTEDSSYARTIYKLNTAQAIEGQVVAIDGNTYVVRDINGVEHRVYADTATSREGNLVIGDRVVVVRGPSTTAYAESITKR